MNLTPLKQAAAVAVGLQKTDPLIGRANFRPFARYLVIWTLSQDGHNPDLIGEMMDVDRTTAIHGIKIIENVIQSSQAPYINWFEHYQILVKSPEPDPVFKGRATINGLVFSSVHCHANYNNGKLTIRTGKQEIEMPAAGMTVPELVAILKQQ